jgi:hypothetical protein
MKRLAAIAPTLLFIACAFAALSPALSSASLFADRYDWRYFDAMGEMSRRAIDWYHQAPLWNPYSCGGEVDLANPQSLEASPSFLLALLFGTAIGYKLAFCFYVFCALDGTRRLALRLGISPIGATLAALGFGLSGYLALHFSEGHLTFIGVALYPYLLLCFDRSLDATEWVIPTGFVAAWIALLGGTFTPPMAGEVLLLWAVMAAVKRRSWRPVALLPLAGIVALAVGAVRMLPVLEFVKDHPRPPFMRAVDWSGPWFILWDLVAYRTFGPLPFRKYWSHEYAARLPYALLPFWIAGLFWLTFSKRLDPAPKWTARRAFGLTLFGVLMTMGNFAPIAPWSLLQKLPVMRDLRVPSRHLVIVTLGLALLAGVAWDFLARHLDKLRPGNKAFARRLGLALIALCAIDGAVYTAINWRGIFTVYINLPEKPVPFFHAEGDWRTMRDHLFQGHGSLGCDEEAPLQRAEGLDPGDVPQERLLDPAAGEIISTDWSPNRRAVTVDLKRATTLFVNSNWNEHWKSDRGKVTRVAGRLAVAELPVGRSTVTLSYAPRSFLAGVGVSVVSLPFFVGLFVVLRVRRGRRGGEGVS